MTNLNLSARADKALDIIADGGRYVHALETDSYTGRTMFKARLRHADGSIAKGFGTATLLEIKPLLAVSYCHPERTEYRMKRGDDDKGYDRFIPAHDGMLSHEQRAA